MRISLWSSVPQLRCPLLCRRRWLGSSTPRSATSRPCTEVPCRTTWCVQAFCRARWTPVRSVLCRSHTQRQGQQHGYQITFLAWGRNLISNLTWSSFLYFCTSWGEVRLFSSLNWMTRGPDVILVAAAHVISLTISRWYNEKIWQC